VYVRAFPEADEARRVSVDGGVEPNWSPDGQTVYYRSLSFDTVFAVPMQSGIPATSSREVVVVLPGLVPQWDVDRVSGRAVVMQTVDEQAPTATGLLVVVNWFEELKARVGNE
jgi:hypothetical protein